MKKQTVISILILAALAAGTSVSAQTTMQGDVSASAGVNSGGGLGSGISTMVRAILGEDSQSAQYTNPVPVAPQAATTTMMMKINAASDISAPVPEARSMMLMSATEASPVPFTDDELHSYSSELLRADSMIQSIDTSDTHVRMTYSVPAKVFGFVRVSLKVTVGVYVSGETEVFYPWYSFATARALSDLDRTIQNRLKPLIPAEPFTPDQQKMLIDEIHAELAARFGSSTQSTT